jgi:hypothetical protein
LLIAGFVHLPIVDSVRLAVAINGELPVIIRGAHPESLVTFAMRFKLFSKRLKIKATI